MLKRRPREIGGMTTFCSKQHLEEFLKNAKLGKLQPFELYQGPPQFVPLGSPIFIFETGREHRLRAIAKFAGWIEVDGWLRGAKNPIRMAIAKQVARSLEKFYEGEGIQPHCTGRRFIDFCSRKDGVRGLFLFDEIVEVDYRSRKDWFRRGDFRKLFAGAQPYAQGFPFRYLSVEEVKMLIEEIGKRSRRGPALLQQIASWGPRPF